MKKLIFAVALCLISISAFAAEYRKIPAANVTNNGTATEGNITVFGVAETEIKDSGYVPSDFILDTDLDTWSEHPALLSGYILTGNATNVTTAVNMSGDVTINNTGVSVVADDSHLHSSVSLPAIASYILSTTTGIDAKIATTTNLYTVPSGKTAVITGAVIRITTADTITVPPTLGIGIVAGEENIFASTQLVGLDAGNEIYKFTSSGTLISGVATEVIKLGIDTGATATTMTITVDLIGYLL